MGSRPLVTAGAMLMAALVGLTALPEIATEVAADERPGSVRGADNLPVGQQHGDSACVASNRKTASPTSVLLGDPVTITLSVQIACAKSDLPLHVVLVLDDSASMAGARLNALIAASRDMIRSLDLASNPTTRLGVVTYSATARTRCQLTNDPGHATACVSGVAAASGASRIDLGLEEAMKVFMQGRAFVADLEDLRQVAILVSDGESALGCAPAVQAANTAMGMGIELYAVSLGPDADATCLIRLASSPAQYFEVRQTDSLTSVFQRIYSAMAEVEVKRLTVTDRLPDNMLFVPDAPGDPSNEPVWDPVNRSLAWVTGPLGRAGVTHTFQVLPVAAGNWPTNVEATGAFVDLGNASGSFTFEVPRVSVLDPSVPPTPDVPGPTDTPTVPNTPTVPATSGPATLFLPRVSLSRTG